MKAISKNQVVSHTADYLKSHLPETHINRVDIHEFKSPNDEKGKPYAVVTTAPSHPQPDIESQNTQSRLVTISILLFYPLEATKSTQRTTNDQNQQVEATVDSYIIGIKNLNNLSDDIINTLTSKEYISLIDMQGIALVNEGEVAIESDAAGKPVLIYTVDIATRSLLTIA